MNISGSLNKYINLEYKKFHEKICQTNYEILGIKIPILRKIVKELLKKYSYQEILNNLNNDYYEHVMMQSLVIANCNVDYKERLKLIDKFLPKIDNWAICDIFCSELKFTKKHKKEFLNYITPYFQNQNEYYQRFAIVIVLDYYINDDYINFILNKILEIKSDYYYVKMAISWCLSICLVKHFDVTKVFFNANKYKFDKWTYNKALQKARESLRISKEKKKILQKMKIK
ncbi:MAG: DNA alkylation repair protein [Firmicutes bacterium]|nr:DNA alkylation repair protein [Bacillota bacterium]